MGKVRIAFMASGRGSNFEAVLDHVELDVLRNCEVVLLVANRAGCRAIRIAEERGIEYIHMDHRGKSLHEYEGELVHVLKEKRIDLIVLAGWDWMVGRTLRTAYEWRLMAIHPSLHPSFTGDLLSAEEVHRAVLESGVKVTGCTVYYVGVNVDMGPIILQKTVEITNEVLELYIRAPVEAVKRLEQKVLYQEHLMLPKAIQLHVDGRLEPVLIRSEDMDRWIVLVREDPDWKKCWEARQLRYIEFKLRRAEASQGVE